MQSAFSTILTFAVIASVPTFAAAASDRSLSAQPQSFVERYQGFCPNGFYHGDPSALKTTPQDQELWGSYCGDKDGDENTGRLETTVFPAPAILELYLAGYPSRPGLTLSLENESDKATLPIKISSLPHEAWRLYQFSVPSAWQGKTVRLIAEDRAVTSGGWFALSRPRTGKARAQPSQALSVVKPLILSFLLIAVVFYAGFCVAAQLGLRSVVLSGLTGLAAVGLNGYLAFWLWFFSPAAGRWSNLLLPCLAALYILWSFSTLNVQKRQMLKELSVPLGLVGATSLLVASMGFLYGGLENPFQTASARFSHALPPDNTIPYLFAEGLVNGHVKRPLLADWLSSDRPPLQTGLYLSQRRFFAHELQYTVVSIVVQSLWIFALWLILRAFRVNGRAASLILLVCLFNGFIFLNNFYTWPKLLAASYVLGFASLLIPRTLEGLSDGHCSIAALAGVLLSLAMLSHGGSMFGIAGAVGAYLLLRRALEVKFFTCMLASAFVLYLPWMLYQKFYEPPGDRLLKYHLAGAEDLDSRTFGQAVADAYGKLTFRAWATDRIDNLLTVVDHQAEYWRDTLALLSPTGRETSNWPSEVATKAEELRAMNFFYLFPCMGPLLAAFVALGVGWLRRVTGAEWQAALRLWLFIAGTTLVWCLLMFKSGSTIIHQGTYALVLLFAAAAILTLWSVSSVVAVIVASFSAALHVLLYVVLMRQSGVRGVLQENSLDHGFLSLSVLSLLSIAAMLWWLSKGREELTRAGP